MERRIPLLFAPERLGELRLKWLRKLAFVVFLAVPEGSVHAHGAHSALMTRLDERLALEPENGNLWYQRAVLEFEHEDWAAASGDFEKADQFAAGSFPILWWQGRILDQQGKLAEAKAALDGFLAKTPGHWGALASRARVVAKLGGIDESLGDFRAALASCPDAQPDLILEVAAALAGHGFSHEAVAVLETGLKRLGAIPSLELKILEVEINSADYDSALSRVDAMQASAVRPEPWMAKRAELLALARRIEESRSAWQALIVHLQNLPNLERGSNSMSLLAERAHNAIAALDRPDRCRLPIKPGSVHEEEMQRANEQITATPGDGKLWYQRGLLLLADGEFHEALLDCDEAERISPGQFATGYVRGQALAGNGELEKGRSVLDTFLTIHPDHIRGHAARARLLLQLRQPGLALADYRTALQLSGDRPEIELVLEAVNAFEADGLRDEALLTLDVQIAALGEVPALLTRSLELETAAGKYNAAISRLDALSKTAPQSEIWMSKRAGLLALAGRDAEARSAWSELLDHLGSMPNLQRGQPAMAALAQQARTAIANLDSNPSPKASN